MYIHKLLMLCICSITLISCNKESDYELIAQEYLEAGYAGNLDKAKSLCVPEAAEMFEFMKTIHAQNPALKTINQAASCEIINAELSEDKKSAQVTVEESNIYAGNIFSQTPPTLVETQATVVNLEKRGNKWLVVVSQ